MAFSGEEERIQTLGERSPLKLYQYSPLKGIPRLLLYSYLFLIFTCVALPSGNIGPVPVKLLAYILVLLLLFTYILLRRSVLTSLYDLSISAHLMLTFLGVWLALSTADRSNSASVSFSAFLSLVITISVVYLSLFLFRSKVLNLSIFFRTVVYASFIYSSIKIAIILLIYIGVFSFESLSYYFENLFRTPFTSLLISPGLIRIQLVNDIATPFLVFFILQAKRINVRFPRFFSPIFLLMSTTSIFFAFSRYIFIVTFALILLHVYINLLRRSRGVILVIFATIALLLFFGISGFSSLAVLEGRFAGSQVTESDSIRVSQWTALVDKIESSPIVGHGIGAYSPEVIRDPEHPYSYELQWVALFLQFGAVGIGIIGIHLILLILPIFRAHQRNMVLAVGIAYLFFLISGFTNPYLISSASGAVFSLFAIISRGPYYRS